MLVCVVVCGGRAVCACVLPCTGEGGTVGWFPWAVSSHVAGAGGATNNGGNRSSCTTGWLGLGSEKLLELENSGGGKSCKISGGGGRAKGRGRSGKSKSLQRRSLAGWRREVGVGEGGSPRLPRVWLPGKWSWTRGVVPSSQFGKPSRGVLGVMGASGAIGTMGMGF